MNPACYARQTCHTGVVSNAKPAILESDQALMPNSDAGQKTAQKGLENHVTGRRIGYVRVSDQDQSENLQLDALNQAGCCAIYRDHGLSGAKRHRPGLEAMLGDLQSGDTLTVWKLDRLGRSTIHLLEILNDLQARGIQFHAITQGFDTNTAVGRMIFGQLAVFAEYERSLISERTKAGMQAAKARGVHVGRPRVSISVS